MTFKSLIKKIVPRPLWEYVRTHKGVLLDSLRNPKGDQCVWPYEGYRLYYNKGNTIIDRLRSQKHFEPQLQDAIVEAILEKDHPVMLDIGANIGLISLAVTSRVPQAVIYAFEPGPIQAALLKNTIEKNGLHNKVTLLPVALGEKDGVMTFHTHLSRDISKDGFMDTGRGEATKPIEVEVMTVDRWWKEQKEPHIDVVKIDTEGAELWVLRGATEMIRTIKPVIFFEMELSNLKAYPYTQEDIMHWFEAQGYKLYTLQEEECHFFNVEKLLRTNDTFVARPAKRNE